MSDEKSQHKQGKSDEDLRARSLISRRRSRKLKWPLSAAVSGNWGPKRADPHIQLPAGTDYRSLIIYFIPLDAVLKVISRDYRQLDHS